MKLNSSNMENHEETSLAIEKIAYFVEDLKIHGLSLYVKYLLAIPLSLLNTYVILILIAGIIFHRSSINPGLIFLLNLAVSDLIHSILLSVYTDQYDVQVTQS